jgi:hypothetical protein
MSQFCYLHREFKIHQKDEVNFLIDASGSNLPIYFALKVIPTACQARDRTNILNNTTLRRLY